MDLNRLSQMTDHVTNSLMAHLSNELYFDYRETPEETAAFEEFMLECIKPVLKASKEGFLQQKELEIEQKKYQSELDNIVKLLRKWRKERRLSVDLQKANILGNVLEELTELVRAKTSNELVDALCDICIFAINANSSSICYKYGVSYDLQNRTSLFNFINASMQDVRDDRLPLLICRCCSSIQQLGYNPFKALHEVVKEISSRTGSFDEKTGKFVKDAGVYNETASLKAFETDIRALYPDDNVIFEYRDNEVDVNIDYGKSIYTYKLWYKADFDKCKEQ